MTVLCLLIAAGHHTPVVVEVDIGRRVFTSFFGVGAEVGMGIERRGVGVGVGRRKGFAVEVTVGRRKGVAIGPWA
jgi:hypothetical protein